MGFFDAKWSEIAIAEARGAASASSGMAQQQAAASASGQRSQSLHSTAALRAAAIPVNLVQQIPVGMKPLLPPSEYFGNEIHRACIEVQISEYRLSHFPVILSEKSENLGQNCSRGLQKVLGSK